MKSSKKLLLAGFALSILGSALMGCSSSDELKPEKHDPTLESLPPAPNEPPPGGGPSDSAAPGPKKGGT